MVINIITAENIGQFARPQAAMFEDRKRIFVDLLRWDLAVVDGRFEIDDFDNIHTVYFLSAGNEDNHRGSLRLLRADRPHILGSLFPYLCGCDVPSGPNTAEITRLCLSPSLPAAERLRVRNRLISAMVDYALACGIDVLTGVVSVPFLEVILAMGWRCEPLGPPMRVDGATIAAFRIDLDSETPQLLRSTGIYIEGVIPQTSGSARRPGEEK